MALPLHGSRLRPRRQRTFQISRERIGHPDRAPFPHSITMFLEYRMIQLSRLLAKQLVSVIKKALNRSKPTPNLTVRSGDEGLLIDALSPNYAVRYHDPRS